MSFLCKTFFGKFRQNLVCCNIWSHWRYINTFLLRTFSNLPISTWNYVTYLLISHETSLKEIDYCKTQNGGWREAVWPDLAKICGTMAIFKTLTRHSKTFVASFWTFYFHSFKVVSKLKESWSLWSWATIETPATFFHLNAQQELETCYPGNGF